MEKSIFQYLEFLLPAHNCVIIPGFGGFIINITPSKFNSVSEVEQPLYSIVFNPELKHDDGLIASYIVKDKNSSYNAASKEIKIFVNTLISDLKSGKIVPCANIGSLSCDISGNIIFSSDSRFIHPDFYGLEPVRLKQLNYIETGVAQAKKRNYLKYTASSVAAAVAALFFFIAPSVNIVELNDNSQKADFLSSITTSLNISDVKKNELLNTFIDSTAVSSFGEETEPSKAIPTRTYYIIIGGEEEKGRAERLLSKIQSNDFPGASMIESVDRFRIYISSFDDKKEAETFLESFRKNNPKYETAWLYSKRNVQ